MSNMTNVALALALSLGLPTLGIAAIIIAMRIDRGDT
jgi:hypothetical protein